MIENLKKKDKEYLESIISKSFDKSKFIDEEILNNICRISGENNIEICLLISRKGVVLDVSSKNSRSAEIKVSSSNVLTGERVIHTHPSGDSRLSAMDISLLKNNMCDCVCAISVRNNQPYDAHIAFYDGKNLEDKFIHDSRYINKFGLLEKIDEIDEIVKNNNSLKLNEMPVNRAVLVMVDLKNLRDSKNSFDELEGLSKTANIEVVGKISQKREKPDGKFMIGQGKLEELKHIIQLNNANLVIFENELSGSKLSNLESALSIKVIDRSMLILDIFAGRAKTNEGKLQVKLAQLKYSLPRLSSLNNSEGRFGGGVGMRGPGETKLELNRRVVENNILKLNNELKRLKKQREINRSSRSRNSKPVVCIVGYTNSGKSSLLNLLAKSDVYVKNELFATLDTTTRNVWLADGKEIILTDTVGFISNLPHEFIEAFSSTLEECKYADLLLHVVDASDENFEEHITVTNNVLNKLGCVAPKIMVFNKTDKVKNFKISNKGDIAISVLEGRNINKLKEMIIEKLGI